MFLLYPYSTFFVSCYNNIQVTALFISTFIGFYSWFIQTCYQSDQSDERLQIDLSDAIVRSNLIDLPAKTRVVNCDLINLYRIELSEFKLT